MAVLVPGPAFAAEPVSLSLDFGVVSDYRFRGVSYSGRDPAVQAELAVEHEAGPHASLWASSISESSGGANLEIDLAGGWLFALSERLSLDVGATYYLYPGDNSANYIEPMLAAAYQIGAVKTRLTIAYVPPQGATRGAAGRKRDNVYASIGSELPISRTPVTLYGEVGYEHGAFDFARRGAKWDWQLGGTLDVKGVSLGLAYVDSTIDGEAEEGTEGATDATVVGSLLFGF
jgi:uncharacterized protein (TIGR02001 family)